MASCFKSPPTSVPTSLWAAPCAFVSPAGPCSESEGRGQRPEVPLRELAQPDEHAAAAECLPEGAERRPHPGDHQRGISFLRAASVVALRPFEFPSMEGQLFHANFDLLDLEAGSRPTKIEFSVM